MYSKITFSFLVFWLIPFSIFAQIRIEKISENINEVSVFNGLFVEIVSDASENKIEIKGEDRGDVKVKIKNGKLKLSLPINHIFSESDISIVLSLIDFSKINANQGAEVEFKNKINRKTLDLESSEGSLISGEIDLQQLNIKAVTGGIFNLYGEVVSQDITINSGGIYDSKAVESENTEVKVSYGGEAKIFASKKCDAKVTAGGNIKIFGQPKELTQVIKLGGNIEEME
ncbi:head GIN domain-containing protein [Psychroflexus aestuariivivens]|uniref:head GIN domain-containing protein n=1 Tax=Psychroflexus aestuariivivens TaxID=1795040 RepID=UPI000FDB8F2F|nr:head GIN domain-containing protein [Psychroflexus aestuariivivens]